MTLPEFKIWFDPQLSSLIHTKVAAYRQITTDAAVLSYCNHMEPLVTQGGKRVRPYLAWLMYRACGGKDDAEILSSLYALELFHTFCLIHDDIIDHGTQRHGVVTTHVFVEQALNKQKGLGDLTHMSEGQAILVGDLLFSEVVQLLRDVPRDVADEFMFMFTQVMLGQMLDVDTSTRASINRDTLNEKIALKTAGYSFISPLKIGARLAQHQEKESWCATVGLHIGAAFQIQDDLLDITGLAHNTENKTAGNDLRDGQHTFLTLYITEHGSQDQKEALARYFHHDFAVTDIPNIIALFESTGAVDAARAKVTNHILQARQAIESAAFPEPYQSCWFELLHLLEKRA